MSRKRLIIIISLLLLIVIAAVGGYVVWRLQQPTAPSDSGAATPFANVFYLVTANGDHYALDQNRSEIFCQAGDRAIGGGGTFSACDSGIDPYCLQGNVSIEFDGPITSSAGLSGWRYVANAQNGNNIPDTNRIFVLCVRASSNYLNDFYTTTNFSSDTTSTNQNRGTASCNTGDKAIFGGGFGPSCTFGSGNPTCAQIVYQEDNQPTPTAANPTGWRYSYDVGNIDAINDAVGTYVSCVRQSSELYSQLSVALSLKVNKYQENSAADPSALYGTCPANNIAMAGGGFWLSCDSVLGAICGRKGTVEGNQQDPTNASSWIYLFSPASGNDSFDTAGTFATCVPSSLSSCGDGVVDPGEQCDDSNLTNGDSCSSLCQTTTQCNDGIDNDGDTLIDCTPGAQDPGCFPNGRGGGGACDTNDNSELDQGICSPGSQSQLITFDDIPGFIPAGQSTWAPGMFGAIGGSRYQSQGVIFSDNTNLWSDNAGGLTVWQDPQNGGASTAPNGICSGGPTGTDGCTAHTITLTFPNPINYFEVVATAGPGGSDWLSTDLKISAFGAANALLGEDTPVPGNSTHFERLSVSANNITRVELTNGLGERRDSWDDVAFCIQAAAAAVCGNSTVEAGEQCDDGNTTAGDGCSATCQTTTQCSDGVDNDGDTFIDCTAGAEDPGCFPDGMGGGGACNPADDSELDTNAVPVCGNGVVETGEQCDDNNTTAGDSCSATCQTTTQCSDGVDNDTDGATDCTAGAEDPGCFPDGMGGGGACDPTDNSEPDATVGQVCGNGTLEGSEACDDGNTTAGDSCSATCTITTQCNDGVDNDGDGDIDCVTGNSDPGCFPNGNGGGGSCNPNDNAETNTASSLPNTALFDQDWHFLLLGGMMIALGLIAYKLNFHWALLDNMLEFEMWKPFMPYEERVERKLQRRLGKSKKRD